MPGALEVVGGTPYELMWCGGTSIKSLVCGGMPRAVTSTVGL